MVATNNIAPPSYYEGLADELETIAESIRKNPQLNHHFAERLKEMAQQMRDDLRLIQLTGKPSGQS
jgi:hypothetical protein